MEFRKIISEDEAVCGIPHHSDDKCRQTVFLSPVYIHPSMHTSCLRLFQLFVSRCILHPLRGYHPYKYLIEKIKV